jgi:cobalt/nickel transport system permease protein
MRSRGYTGRMPLLSVEGATRSQWLEGLTISLAAVAIAVAARVVAL